MSQLSVDWSELSLQIMMTFGHFLWQGCLVAIALAIVEQLFSIVSSANASGRKQAQPSSSSLRYWIACIAFFGMPLCVVTTFVWVHQSRGPVVLVANRPIASPAAHIASDPTQQPSNSEIPLMSTPTLPEWPELAVAEPLETPSLAATSAPSAQSIQSYASYLLIAYLTIVCMMLGRFGLSIFSSSRMQRTLHPITDSNLLRIIAQQSARLGLKRIPIVTLCERISVPVVVGIVKPTILLPPVLLCGLGANQLGAVLSHEMAHIRRYDLLVNVLQRIVEALLFFHPATWWVSRRISIERENCCDDLAAGNDRLEYATALLQMAEQCVQARGLRIAPQLESLAADGGSGSQFGYRIKRLLGESHSPQVPWTRGAFVSIAICTVLGALALVAVAQSGGGDPTDGQKEETVDRTEDMDDNWGEASDGLRCRIVPVSPSMDPEKMDLTASNLHFASPEEITFAVEVQNVSDKAVFVRDIRYGGEYAEKTRGKLNANHYAPHLFDFVFTDSQGKAIARAEREFVIDSHAIVLRGAMDTKLAPNQSLKCLLKPAKFERSMGYRLPPGDYRVKVRYRGPSQAVKDWIDKHNTGQDSDKLWASEVSSKFASFSVAADTFHEPDLVWGQETSGLRAALEVRAPRESGIPTQAPGVLPATALHPILHVKNVTDKPITFVSETGRQGDTLKIKDANGSDIKVKDVWFSGWPIDVRWTLQPGDVAQLDVLTPSLNQGLVPGKYTARYTIRFNSRQQKDKDGNQVFPAPGDYDSEIDTGWTPLLLRGPIQGRSGSSHDIGKFTVGTQPPASTDSGQEDSRSKNLHQSVEPAPWVSASPKKVSLTSAGTAHILDDHSVRLSSDVQWQEATLQYAFEKPSTIEEIRLEILPTESPSGPQFGTGGRKLILFDVKPSMDRPAGKRTSLEFSSATYLQDPEDETTANCIDFLTDTGWTVPTSQEAEAHVLVMRLSKPIQLQADQRLTLVIDSGGSDELAVFNRIRFSFPQKAPEKEDAQNLAHEPAVAAILKETFRLPEHRRVGEASFLRDSQSIVSLAWETAANQKGLRVTLRTWSLAEQQQTREIDLEWQPNWTQYVSNLLLSHDGTRIVGLLGGQIAVWNAGTGDIAQRHDIPEEIKNDTRYSVSLSNLTGTPDLSRIAFGRSVSLGGTMPSAHAIVMDTHSGRVLQQIKMEHRIHVRSLALSADGKRLATVGSQYGASIWDVESGKLILDFRNDNANRKHPDSRVKTSSTQLVSSVRFSPVGHLFAVSDMLGIKLVDAQTGKVLRRIDAPYRYHNANSQFIFSPDGQLFTLLGTLPADGKLRTIGIWSTESGERLRTLAVDATAAAFSVDGKWFTAGKSDRKEALVAWQIRDDKPANVTPRPAENANAAENSNSVLSVRLLSGEDGRPVSRGYLTLWKALERGDAAPANSVNGATGFGYYNPVVWNDTRHDARWIRAGSAHPNDGRHSPQGVDAYHFKSLKPGRYRVTAMAYDREANAPDPTPYGASEPIDIDGTTPETMHIELQQGDASLTVVAIDAQTRQPIKGLAIRLRTVAGMPIVHGHGSGNFFEWTSDRGAVQYAHLLSGDFLVEVLGKQARVNQFVQYEPQRDPVRVEAKPGPQQIEVAVKPRQLLRAEIDRRFPFSVFGRVTDTSGNPVANAVVRAATGAGTLLGGGKTKTDSDGKYLLYFGPGMRTKVSDEAPQGVGVQAAHFYVDHAGWAVDAEDGYLFYLMTDMTTRNFQNRLNRQSGKIWGKTSVEEVVFAGQQREINIVLKREPKASQE